MMDTLFARLDSSRKEFLQLAGSLDDDRFTNKPGFDQWSVAEIIQHLCLVERLVMLQLKRSRNNLPKPPGFFTRFKPIAAVAFRTFKVKAPDLAVPKAVLPRAELMELFASTREELRAFAAEVSERDLLRLSMRHPLFGEISGVAALKFIHNHERRHLKQAREALKRAKHTL